MALRPTDTIAASNKEAVDCMYQSAPAYGTHKLICVRKDSINIALTTHPEPEEVLCINMTPETYKPLYLILALHKGEELEKRTKAGNVTAQDFMALELSFADPKAWAFTVCAGTAHCEITTEGKGVNPVFFVTEPTDMTMAYVDMHGISLTLGV